jgi:DNA primase
MRETQEIKTANPLPNLAEAYGIALRQSGQGFIGRCPFHEDRNPSFSIYLADSGWRFRCYGASCGLAGDVIDFQGYQLFGHGWNNRDPEMFKAALLALEGATTPRPRSTQWHPLKSRPDPYQKVTDQIVRAWELALSLYQDILLQTPEALAYVHGRGLTDETIRKYRFGFCPPDGSGIEALARLARIDPDTLRQASILREYTPEDGEVQTYEYFWGRITFADLDASRRVRYISGRRLPTPNISDDARKYIGLAGFPKTVFNLQRVTWKREPVFVVEAPLDAITIDQMGFDAVALHGAHPSARQKQAMRRITHPVFIKDNDPAGAAALAAWREAIPSPHPALDLPEEIDGVHIKDPNDLIAKLDRNTGRRIFRQLAQVHGWKPR